MRKPTESKAKTALRSVSSLTLNVELLRFDEGLTLEQITLIRAGKLKPALDSSKGDILK